jgi:DNA-binding MarR family transcriptional regulator
MLKFQLVPYGKIDHESAIRAAMRNTGNEDQLDADLFEVTSDFLSKEIDVEKVKSSVPKWAENRIVALAQIIAKLRTEVERDFRGEQVKYRPQDEVATRLGKQLKKAAMLMTLTNDDPNGRFLESDFAVVERLAFDTAIGWNLDVVQAMMTYDNGKGEVSTKDLTEKSGLPRSNISRKLDDLLLLKVVTKIQRKATARNEDRILYRLTPEIRELWRAAEIKTIHVDRVMSVAKGRKIKIRRTTRRP